MPTTPLLPPPAANEHVADADITDTIETLPTTKKGLPVHQITIQIRERLDWNIRVNGALVVVCTNEQVTHLSGTVGTARQDAEQDARHMVGVAEAHNLLEVRPARLVPDEDSRRTTLHGAYQNGWGNRGTG